MDRLDCITDDIKIKNLSDSTEIEARNLIIEGLSEYFDNYDESKNPDLNNLMQNYIGKGETFLIGLYEDDIICTGSLIEEDRYTGRIVRMSVKKEYRRKGVATVILKKLEKVAKAKGYNKIVLETTEDWIKAINLYKKNGYTESKRTEGNVHLFKKL